MQPPMASMMQAKDIEALQCDANYLYQNDMFDAASVMLPKDEREMLRLYNQLNQEGKENLPITQMILFDLGNI